MYSASIQKDGPNAEGVTWYDVRFTAPGVEGRVYLRLRDDMPDLPEKLREVISVLFPPNDNSPQPS